MVVVCMQSIRVMEDKDKALKNLAACNRKTVKNISYICNKRVWELHCVIWCQHNFTLFFVFVFCFNNQRNENLVVSMENVLPD